MHHEKALARLFGSKPERDLKRLAGFTGFAGKWKNQYGSVAEFKVSGNSVTGTYTSAVSSGGGSVSGPITGHVKGDIICFSVLWPSNRASMTTWSGQVVDDDGIEILKTLWHLVTDIDDASEPTGLWTATLAGADEFKRV